MPTKAEKLAIASYAAPRLRDGSTRRIKTTDRDGRVVREIGDADLAAKMLERAGIELDVHRGVARTHKICPCGRVWTPPRVGGGVRTPDACPRCRSQAVCVGWDGGPCPDGSKPNRTSFTPCEMKKRGGGPWQCHRCTMRRTQAERTRKMIETTRRPESRAASAERAKAWHASRTPEEEKERLQKIKTSRTVAPRTHCKNGHELTPENTERTPKGRTCRACREQALSTAPLRRAESMRATLAATPEDTKSARSKRGWETRRARYSPDELAEQAERTWEARRASMPPAEVLAARAKRAWETRRARYGPSGGQ
jgi:hypothetical protein